MLLMLLLMISTTTSSTTTMTTTTSSSTTTTSSSSWRGGVGAGPAHRVPVSPRLLKAHRPSVGVPTVGDLQDLAVLRQQELLGDVDLQPG